MHKCSVHNSELLSCDGFEWPAEVTPSDAWFMGKRLFPNCVVIRQSLVKTKYHTHRAKVIYCPKCQAGMEQYLKENGDK